MKKVLLMIPALYAGGAERVMVTLANEWSKSMDITIMVFNDGNCFYDLSNKVRIKSMNCMPSNGHLKRILSIPMVELSRLSTIYKEIKNGDYDFCIAFCFTMNVFASICSILLKDSVICISERNDPHGYSLLTRKVINSLYKCANTVICQNIMVEDYFKSRGFKNRLVVLPNPVCFDDIPVERPENIEKSIVTVGRLIEQKNQLLLIEAFKEVVVDFPDYVLRIYGKGPLEHQLREYIQKNGLENKVYLMGTQKKVMFEVNNSSIFILPSNFEGFPNVLIEAMATGMPVISSDFKTGIASQLVKNGENGYLFEVGNKAQLVDSLKMLLSKTTSFHEIGEKNRQIAAQYKDEVIAQLWLDTLNT